MDALHRGKILASMSIPVIDDAAFEAYSQEVDVYEQTWHTDPVEPQRAFLDGRPQLKSELFLRALKGKRTFTNHVYAAEGAWVDERRALQNELLSGLLDDGTPASNKAQTVYFLIGLPGSGKSSALRPLVSAHSGLELDAVRVSDADDLRTAFPEYAGGLGSGVVQDECSELMYDRRTGANAESGVQGAILNSGGVTIVDVIGSPEYLPPLVRRLRRLGRRVYVLQASCETDTCIARAKARAIVTGRLVPPAVILSKHGVPEKTMEALKASAGLSGWAVVDTNGSVPRVTESYSFEVVAAA